MALPSDVSRCLGRRDFLPDSETCPRRESCDRYVDWITPQGSPGEGWRVPVNPWLCDDGAEFFVPVPKVA